MKIFRGAFKLLSRGLKKFMPNGLMGRSLLLVIIPVMLLQFIVGYAFYNRHWEIISKKMVESYVNSIRSAQFLIEREGKDKIWIKDYFKEVEGMQVIYLKNVKFVKRENVYPYFMKKYASTEQLFRNAFGVRMYNIQANEIDKNLRTEVAMPNGGTLVINSSLSKLFASSILVVFIWIILGGFIVMLIAVPFIRNQVKSIEALALATESFGKGQEVVGFKPSGATQIRRTGLAFIQMQERIGRFLDNRMKMLSAISHDLRTPLTRMILEVERSKDLDLKENLVEEIEDMKKMIDEYLDYAKGEGGEITKLVDINDLLENIVGKFDKFDKKIVFQADKIKDNVAIKPEAIKRCLDNVISNALKYGETKVLVKMIRNKRTLVITVQDDGPGIPENRREDMFKPFARLENSRNSQTGGVGLGLAIAKEIVLAHGGEIFLEDGTSLKGLKVRIVLPL